MKKYFTLAVACIALVFSSCQKDQLENPITNSTTAADASSQAELPLIDDLLDADQPVNYGALIGAPTSEKGNDFQLSVADQLGISCIRSRVVLGNRPTSLLNTKYKIVLNFVNKVSTNGSPLPFATDLNKYQTDLINTLSKFSVLPAVAVIENEESNKGYYSGTANEYIRQLNTAISVMHAKGIKVANGGITNTGLNYLVYQDFLNQGKADSAELFKQWAKVAPRSTMAQERGAFINTLLQSYAQMDLDYVNFHWKATSPDTRAVTCVIAYLKKVTGKPVISNELGQFDTDPNTVTALVQKVTDEKFPYALWYSPDENAGKKDTPLHNDDETLTPNGVAYKASIKD